MTAAQLVGLLFLGRNVAHSVHLNTRSYAKHVALNVFYDEVIDKAVNYYVKMTSESGQVAYAGGFGGFDESIARISIATLVYSVARRKDLPQFKATIKYLTQRLESSGNDHYAEYTRYYQSQALFQGDVEAWEKWNKQLVRQLKTTQAADGSEQGQFGPAIGTSLSMLSLALNYRFLPIYER